MWKIVAILCVVFVNTQIDARILAKYEKREAEAKPYYGYGGYGHGYGGYGYGRYAYGK